MAARSAPALIQNITHLLRARRFLPLFATQLLGAFNDSLFKQAVVLFVTYQLYSNPAKEFQFSAIAQGLFILPFFLLSALSGQLADDHDKARLIRIIKLAEIGIMIVGGAGLHARQHPADARRGVRDGRSFDLLRPDQICDPAAASATRTKCSAAPGWSRPAPISRSWRHDPRRRAGGRRRVAAAVAVIGFAVLGYLAGRQVPPAPPAASGMPIDLAHRPRLDRAGQRDDAHPPAVPRDPRDQLLLDDRRGADHHLPAAGEERARRRRAGRQPVHRHLLGRHRDRLGADQPPAQEPGLGALRAGLGARDGRVRADAPLRRRWPGASTVPDSPRSAISSSPDGRPDDPRPARRRDHRRHVRGAALRLPDDDRAQDRDGAHGRGQQHRQFGRDGDRLAARLRAQQPRASARSGSCCWSRRCAWSRPGSAGSSTSPATKPISRSAPRRTGSRRRKSWRTA